jgi:hypothetical protein
LFISETKLEEELAAIKMGEPEVFDEKSEQNAPLLSPDEYDQNLSDNESVHSEDTAVKPSTVSSLHPAFFIG